MRKILAIQWFHTKEFVKSPAVWVLMVVLPTVFSFIFGGIAVNSVSHKPLVNIVVSEGAVNSQVLKLLMKNDQFQWEEATEIQAKENVLNQETIAAVVIPKNISERIKENKPLFDVILQRKSEQYLGLAPYLEGTGRVIGQSYHAVGNTDEKTFITLLKAVTANEGVKIDQEIIKQNDEFKGIVNLMFIGFAIMFMMFGLSGATSAILDEKLGGTWSRLLITPATKQEITVGYLGTYFCMGWVQFAILMVATSILFDTSWGNLTYLIPFASLVILCVVGFSLMIAGLVKTKQQAMALSAVLITSTCMLGGVYWSLDIVPEFMQKIALGVPQSWAMSGFEEIISGSLHQKTLIKDTLALFGFTAVFFSIGLRLIKH
jgi:ABC-2 type transport system permease protein